MGPYDRQRWIITQIKEHYTRAITLQDVDTAYTTLLKIDDVTGIMVGDNVTVSGVVGGNYNIRYRIEKIDGNILYLREKISGQFEYDAGADFTSSKMLCITVYDNSIDRDQSFDESVFPLCIVETVNIGTDISTELLMSQVAIHFAITCISTVESYIVLNDENTSGVSDYVLSAENAHQKITNILSFLSSDYKKEIKQFYSILKSTTVAMSAVEAKYPI